MPASVATAVFHSMRTLLLALLAAGVPLPGFAQSSCSSDGQAAPAVLYERFINADCASCWGQAAAHVPGPSALVLDWIVPGSAGEDAPLSAAATTDAQARLEALQRPVPATTDTHIDTVVAASASATGTATARASRPARLRVAHGLPFNDYLGTSIAFTPAAVAQRGAPPSSGPWNFYLLLVESVPAGTDGTPVARQVVRNVLTGIWAQPAPSPKRLQHAWQELRPARIAAGARVENLYMVGWVQNAQGSVVVATRSVCRQ